jgi:microcystin-dependent protein
MRNLLLPLFGFFFSVLTLAAQAPDAFNYQAVLRDASGMVRAGEDIILDVAIRQGGPGENPVYEEQHDVQTNPLGGVNLAIGTGATEGDFSAIDWGNGPYYITISVDGQVFSTSQLLSVPFSKYADEAGNTFSGDYQDLVDTPDLTNYVMVEGQVEGNLITYDGNNWIATDLVVDNTGGGQPVNNMQPYLGINYCIALVGLYPSRNGAEPFIGEIMIFGGNFAPRGWAFCDGQLLPVSQNTALFSLLGTTYGGDGRTTFALPDLRGRVPLHPGTGPGLSSRQLGEKGGTETNVLTIGQMPAHNHTITKQ